MDFNIFVGNLTVKYHPSWAVFGRRPLLMRARGMARNGMMDRAFDVMEEEALPDGVMLNAAPAVVLNAMPARLMNAKLAVEAAVPAVLAVLAAPAMPAVPEPRLMMKRRYTPFWRPHREPLASRQAWIPVVNHKEAEGQGTHSIGR